MGHVTHKGSCHCGVVTFTVEAPARLEAVACNCSICTKTGFIGVFVDQEQFSLLSGEEALSTYRFNTGIARHTFCRHCGVKAFYVPRSHPNQVSINLNCLDPQTIAGKSVKGFDGQNWEANIAALHEHSPAR